MLWNSLQHSFFSLWSTSDIENDLENILDVQVATSQPTQWGAAGTVGALMPIMMAAVLACKEAGHGPWDRPQPWPSPCFCNNKRLSGWPGRGRWWDRHNSMAPLDKLGASCFPVHQTSKERLSLCPQKATVVQWPTCLFVSRLDCFFRTWPYLSCSSW